MPSIGSETYRSSELPESATKETKISESAEATEAIKGEDFPERAPFIASLNPDTMEVPGPDAPLALHGAGFTPDSIIIWNGGEEPTEFINESELQTTVKPSTVQVDLPFSLPVLVRTGDLESNVVSFTFTEADPPASKRSHSKKEEAPEENEAPKRHRKHE